MLVIKLGIILILGSMTVTSEGCPSAELCVQSLGQKYNDTLMISTTETAVKLCLETNKGICLSEAAKQCGLIGDEDVYRRYKNLQWRINTFCSENVCSDLTAIHDCWNQLDYSGIPKSEYFLFCWSVNKCKKRPLTSDACNATNLYFESDLSADSKKIIHYICDSHCENLNQTIDAVKSCIGDLSRDDTSCGSYNGFLGCLDKFSACPEVFKMVEYFHEGFNDVHNRCGIDKTIATEQVTNRVSAKSDYEGTTYLMTTAQKKLLPVDKYTAMSLARNVDQRDSTSKMTTKPVSEDKIILKNESKSAIVEQSTTMSQSANSFRSSPKLSTFVTKLATKRLSERTDQIKAITDGDYTQSSKHKIVTELPETSISALKSTRRPGRQTELNREPVMSKETASYFNISDQILTSNYNRTTPSDVVKSSNEMTTEFGTTTIKTLAEKSTDSILTTIRTSYNTDINNAFTVNTVTTRQGEQKDGSNEMTTEFGTTTIKTLPEKATNGMHTTTQTSYNTDISKAFTVNKVTARKDEQKDDSNGCGSLKSYWKISVFSLVCVSSLFIT